MNQFNLTWEVIQTFPIISLDGDITFEAEKLLEETYHAIMDNLKAKQLIFDFSKIDYINSAGISSFIRLFRIHNETGGDFIFTGLSDHIKKVLDILELTDYVKVFKTVEMAIQYCQDEL
jgi:anti-anti-sigma factor